MTKTIIFFEDHHFRQQAKIDDSRVLFELLGVQKDGSTMPLQYVSINFKDLEMIYKEIKARL